MGVILLETDILKIGSVLKHGSVAQHYDQNTYNFTFLAGSALQFSSLVLLANHSHMCKCWASYSKRENVDGGILTGIY